MPDDFIYKAQDVNYLGFLRNQLSDMQGIATLTYELIQNAEDVRDADGRPGSRWISFDVRDDALVVENDGVFLPVDFERLQTIAGGGKRAETGTIGAFGFGFLAVYQVTDAPEIYSGGRHWTIRPEAPAGERIEERPAETAGTRLRLPWALNPESTVRQALRLPAVRREGLDDLARAIAEALETAALFLRQLDRLEVRRDGEVVARVQRSFDGRQLRLRDESGREAAWLLLEGEFGAAAAALRARHPQLEEAREVRIQLALSLEDIGQQGRLFAGLPTGSSSPLPFHINADFYPTSDRKRIHFGDGYQAAWNEAALQAAARLLGDNLDALRRALRPVAFWQLLQQLAYTRQLAAQRELPTVFGVFWRTLVPLFAETPILFTVQEEWVLPAEGRLPARTPGEALLPILEGLGLSLPHPALAPYFELMREREVGVPPLALADLVEALAHAGLTGTTFLHDAPRYLASLEQWQALWRLFDRLSEPHAPPRERAEARRLLNRVAIALTEAMTLDRPDRVFRGSSEARALFPDATWAHPQLPEESFPGRLVADFGVRQAVTSLAARPVDRLEEAWRMGHLDLPRLFRWFESEQIEIFADDPALQREILRLPLCPIGGELRPLAHLYIPGGFEDPLGLAGIVPLDALGGRRQFLEDLGVEALRFDAYIHRELPRVLTKDADLPSDARHRLLALLAERLGEFREDEGIREQLGRLPLIPCLDGSFRPASEVYATRAARTLLGEGVHVAEPVTGDAQAALFRWLGVRDEPSPADLVQRLLALGTQAEADESATETEGLLVASRCWLRLQRYLDQEQIGADALVRLREKWVIPAGNRLAPPHHLFFDGAPALVARFPDLQRHLLDADHPAAPAWALSGVRTLAAAIRREPLVPAGADEAPALQERIVSRLPLIRRVVQAEPGAGLSVDFLENVRALTADPLQVRYRLVAGNDVWLSAPETAPAVLDRDQSRLYVAGDLSPAPWLAIARALARALKGEQAVGALPLALKEVLAAESFAAASELLDELGYPPLNA